MCIENTISLSIPLHFIYFVFVQIQIVHSSLYFYLSMETARSAIGTWALYTKVRHVLSQTAGDTHTHSETYT